MATEWRAGARVTYGPTCAFGRGPAAVAHEGGPQRGHTGVVRRFDHLHLVQNGQKYWPNMGQTRAKQARHASGTDQASLTTRESLGEKCRDNLGRPPVKTVVVAKDRTISGRRRRLVQSFGVSVLTIWPYDHLAIWPFGHLAI